MEIDQTIFKAYDVRGIYPEQINGEIAYKIAVAYANKIQPKTVIIGKDIRVASDDICENIVRGLVDSGVSVKAAGRMTNPMIGFGTWFYDFDGGIIASASHNPIGYGGIKTMKKDAVTIPGEDLKDPVVNNQLKISEQKGSVEEINIADDYEKFLLTQIDRKKIKKLKVFIDPLFGSVGLIIKDIVSKLNIEPVYYQSDPDANFGGLSEPNPLNPEIREKSLVEFKKSGADFGVMWDGDGDRCFFIDELGNFIDAPYITAVLSEYILQKNSGAKIVSDPRILWPISKVVKENGGELVISKSGYRFIKEKMVEVDAVFGAEMTAHYFFKENHNSDNGIIPFLLLLEILSQSDKKLSQLVVPYKEGHFMIDEIKVKVDNFASLADKIKLEYSGYTLNEIDGLTIEADNFRFNIRGSNTEPVVKLNMEAKSKEILDSEKDKLLNILK
ncbi:MAG: phosphomannomutase/phosphoglucomutase [Candidatus Berkelbacteria bacterium]|nr:phosphomannomutase/phosphoglucomutase [Candidatus Berkelbacteria bacterium]